MLANFRALIFSAATLFCGFACSAADKDGKFISFGSGARSCGTFQSAFYGNDEVARLSNGAWVAGYISAYNAGSDSLTKNILEGTDLNGALGWLSNYCLENPTSDFSQAAWQLVRYLGLESALRVLELQNEVSKNTPTSPVGVGPWEDYAAPSQPTVKTSTSAPLQDNPFLKYVPKDAGTRTNPFLKYVPKAVVPPTAASPATPSRGAGGGVAGEAGSARPKDNPFLNLPKMQAPSTPPKWAQAQEKTLSSTPALREAQPSAEIISVKYRGPVSLAPFKCDEITRSSFINRVCYDAANSYMLINLSGTWYHYCELDPDTLANLMAAESMGRFFDKSIKKQFDCRTHHIPQY